VERHEAETEDAVHLLCVVIGVLQSVGHRVDQVLKLLLALFVETREVCLDDLLVISSAELLKVGAAQPVDGCLKQVVELIFMVKFF
jgi:hypothetical protein